MNKPIVYLLCGLPGTGKTTYADKLVVEKGVIKLSIDDSLLNRFGVAGKDYPVTSHSEFKSKVMKDIKLEIADLVSSGHSLVLDFGVWKKQDRNNFRSLVERNGGICQLVYLKADKPLLLKRLNSRNVIENGTKNIVDKFRLDKATSSFEEPDDEGEFIIEQQD